MRTRRVLVGTFDLFNVGHLAQISAVSGPDVDVIVAVVTDDGIHNLMGKYPYLPDIERVDIVGEMADVSAATLIGPKNAWELPVYDELHVDEQTLRALVAAGIDLVGAQPLAATRKPANAALCLASNAA